MVYATACVHDIQSAYVDCSIDSSALNIQIMFEAIILLGGKVLAITTSSTSSLKYLTGKWVAMYVRVMFV